MNLSKSYLQSISTDELLQIAENRGVFVPKGLCRNLIIEELLELNEESPKTICNFNQNDEFLSDDNDEFENTGLPISYNTTEIHVLLRDPMWVFAFWDFYKPEFLTITKNLNFESFFLRVFLFSQNNLSEAYDHFDIDVENDDRSRYFYISFEDMITRVELCSRSTEGDVSVLAKSNFIFLKRENIPHNLCVLENNVRSPLFLSGLSILKKVHFKNYRQAFRIKEESHFEGK